MELLSKERGSNRFFFFFYVFQVLYDFEGQPGTAELTIVAGETLTVSNKDVGEGWWEGFNHQGQCGIFPAAYVEVQCLYALIIA